MTLEILLSCMDQEDFSIIGKSRISGAALIVNQCGGVPQKQLGEGGSCVIMEKDGFEGFRVIRETDGLEGAEGDIKPAGCPSVDAPPGIPRVRMICTSGRGLSNSRNMAIAHAEGDICLLCDDDEVFEGGYEGMVLSAFESLPEADIIAFDIDGKETRLPRKVHRLSRLGSLRLSSVQLAFRRERVAASGVKFDPLLGAGSGNGGGEENKFLLDCLRAGLKIYYVPTTIASLVSAESTWFSGFDEAFFYNRGAATRYMLGGWTSFWYGLYYLAAKRGLYRGTISAGQAARALMRGIRENPIAAQQAASGIAQNAAHVEADMQNAPRMKTYM